MKQSQEIKQNSAGQENFENRICVIFDNQHQISIGETKTGY